MPTIYLIDGTATIHRAYHALPRLTTSRGEPVNAIFGFIKMTLKIMKDERPDYLVVCFDTPEATFRHELEPTYKANRTEMDDDLRTQMPIVRNVVKAWNIPFIEKPGLEADDLIACLAKASEKRGWKVVIVSADKDALQLINPHISVFNDAKGIRYDAAQVEERYGISPGQLIDFFSLTGDAVDNVAGVPGVGEKTAAKLLQEYGSLEKIVENAERLKPSLRETILGNKERLLKNRKLIALEDNVNLGLNLEECRPQPPGPQWAELLKRLEFSSLLREGLAPSIKESAPLNVKIVLSEQDLLDLEKQLARATRLSFDVETSGIKPLECDLVGLALGFNNRTFYIPVGHRGLGAPPQLSMENVLGRLKTYLESPTLPKWGQNLKYDTLVLAAQGVHVEGISMDTLVAAYCLNPSRLTYKLKDMAMDLLGEKMTRLEDVAGPRPDRGLEAVEVKAAADYAGADTNVVLRLGELFLPQIHEKNMDRLFFEVEMPLVSVLAQMEFWGIRIDPKPLQSLGREFEAEKTTLQESIYELTGSRFNINSPKQLAEVLFERLKLPVIRRTKTGCSTDEEVLNKLKKAHPAAALLLSYRELSKLKSTYIDALTEMVNPRTGRVHTSFNQSGTSTGRLSSSDPNLQNIPIRTGPGRKIRRAFVPEPGFLFVSADYSQIDLRVLAHMSQDPALLAAFRSSGDVHLTTAAEVFHVPRESVTPEMRQKAKAINFGIVYGQQAFGLSQQLNISVDEAKDTIEKYFLRYSGVKKWMEETLQEARAAGFVSTLLGRRRALPELTSQNSLQRSFAERAAVNTPIQGTSADVIKLAMIKIHHFLREQKWRARMLVQVHDELLFEIREEDKNELIPALKQMMENALLLSVPLIVDVKTGRNWADLEAVTPKLQRSADG
jgi:DNA polymerase-1